MVWWKKRAQRCRWSCCQGTSLEKPSPTQSFAATNCGRHGWKNQCPRCFCGWRWWVVSRWLCQSSRYRVWGCSCHAPSPRNDEEVKFLEQIFTYEIWSKLSMVKSWAISFAPVGIIHTTFEAGHRCRVAVIGSEPIWPIHMCSADAACSRIGKRLESITFQKVKDLVWAYPNLSPM